MRQACTVAIAMFRAGFYTLLFVPFNSTGTLVAVVVVDPVARAMFR